MVETVEPTTPTETGSRLTRTDLLLFLMTVIWGSNFTFIKYSLEDLEPLAFNGLRMAFAAVLVAVAARIAGYDFKVQKGDWWKLFAIGLLANTCYQATFIIGMARTRAGNAALIVSTTPLFTAVYGRIRGHEHFTRKGVLGLLLACVGIALIVIAGNKEVSLGETLPGDLLLLVATICWSLHTVGSKSLIQRYGSTKATALMMLTGTPVLLLICLPALFSQDWPRVRAVAWSGLIFSSVFAIAVAYVIWNYGVRKQGSTRTAAFGYITPVIAMLVAWIVLNEVPTAGQVVGAGVIIFGLYLTRAGTIVTSDRVVAPQEGSNPAMPAASG
jgi:drug/metabolite transporter (DMT)-like permease